MTLFRAITSDIISDVATSNVISGVVTNVVPDGPVGYSVAWDTDPINAANVAAGEFTLTGGLADDEYQYIITSDEGGTPVTDSGTLVGNSPYTFDNLDLSGLNDGTITVSLILTRDGVTGDTVYAEVLKDTEAPSGYTVAWVTDPIDGSNDEAAAFNIVGGEEGATYDYEITSSGGGTPVADSGTISGDPEEITGVDVTGLNDGTLTVSVTLTDAAGNQGSAVTDDVTKSTA